MSLTRYRRTPRGNWYLRGTVQGHHIHESTGTGIANQAEAIRIRREAELLERGAFGKAQTLSFAEAALAYMDAGGEARFLARILTHFGPDTLLSEIDNAAINAAAAALYPGAAAATVNRQLITPISAVVTMAANEGLATPRKFKRRKGDRIRTRWLTPEEATALIKAAPPHILPALGFMLGGGARSSEALGIDMAHFYPATAEAWLSDTKNGHPRMLRLPAAALDLVRACPLPDTGPICRTPKGKPYILRANGGGQISAAFAEACRGAGLDPKEVTPHTLRHTWATWFYAQTKDFGGLLDLGGWQKADMAQRYRKIAPGDLPERLVRAGWDFTELGQIRAVIGQPEARPVARPGQPSLRVIK
ncbi:site-specific integrase [Falsihalocynthiibacter arcticus]|uniref:tyrosine-type recombinase/integrase n=1 Tax=Falsihalocynthiibacter arcticus TaxID=1579316 RepID=UPI003001CEA7